MPCTRRKAFKNSGTKHYTTKTLRRELCPSEKAYAVGAMMAGALQYSLAKQLPVTQGALSKLLARTKERAEASKLPIWDPHLYELEPGRGHPELDLSEAQKKSVIAVATRDQEAREKHSWLVIADGDFDHLGLPKKLTVTSFENIMHEAGYARRLPALKHNPQKYKVGGNSGFNYQQHGIVRAWARQDEVYHPDIKRPKIRNNCAPQFYGSFAYDAKGPYHIYSKETKDMKKAAQRALDQENHENKLQRESLVPGDECRLRWARFCYKFMFRSNFYFAFGFGQVI